MSAEILVVDDDLKVLEIISESLDRQGYSVNVATSAEEALQSLERSNPELVVLDMMLPDMSGIELLRHFRTDNEKSDIPVLFLSADGDPDTRLNSLEEGAEDYLVKPVSLREFNARISRVLKRAERTRSLNKNQERLESKLSAGQEHYLQATRELKRQLLSMKTLFSMSQDLNRSLDVEQLCNLVALTLVGELQISSMAVFAIERENAFAFSPLAIKGFDRDRFANASIDRNSQFASMIDGDPKPQQITRSPDRRWARALPDLRLAVFEYVTPIRVKNETKGLIFTGPKIKGGDYSDYDLDMLQFVANSTGIGMENARLITQLEQTYVATLKSLVSVIEAKDPYTKGHTERVAGYAAAIAERLQLSREERRLILFAALLHDIGKLGIMDHVLHKPGALDEEEWELMRSHPTIGASIVYNMAFLSEAADMVKHHHESWDGSGYPSGLEGTDIPMGARIIAVADSFDAMTSDRSYRKALSCAQAISRLQAAAGTQFDPDIVDMFVEYVNAKIGRRPE